MKEHFNDISHWGYVASEKFTSQERKRFIVHMLVAAFSLPIYLSPLLISTIFGLLVSPYLLWMIFNPKKEYFLPLLIHTLWGSQQRYLMLFGCFIYCLMHTNVLARARVLNCFACYILILPFFIWYTYRRYVLFGGGIGHGGTFEGLGYYLAFAPFFWAVAASLRINYDMFKWIIFISALYIVLRFFCGLNFTRFYVWAYDIMPVFLIWSYLRKSKTDYRILLCGVICLILFVISFLWGTNIRTTFTEIGVSAIGIAYVVMAKRFKHIAGVISPLMLFAISVVMVVHIVSHFYDNRGLYIGSESYEEMKIDSVDRLKERIMRKTFDDRAPLWSATWDGICQQFKKSAIWVEPLPISGEIIGQSGQIVQIQLMAHNILLLLQQYGLYGGACLYLMYVYLFSLKKIRLPMIWDFDSHYTPIAAVCIGHAVMGGFSGQYVMNVEFSFILYCMLGAVLVHANELSNQRRGALCARFVGC